MNHTSCRGAYFHHSTEHYLVFGGCERSSLHMIVPLRNLESALG